MPARSDRTMTPYTNRLVVGVVCFLMNLSGLAAAQAPQTPEAFYELVEGKQMVLASEDEDETLPILFLAPGRHSTLLESHDPPGEGDYNYESTGAATGTLELTFDVADNSTLDRISIELTFESPTAGTILFTSFKGGRAEEGGNFPGTFEIVDAPVPVPALPLAGLFLLGALSTLAGVSRLRRTNL